tara:strand:- start:1006 stop:2175 length:1170 start_codon:yes stop_codon:yes gene_type:complete
MSNMLEQAIADAAALREQAIKNAEQSVIEKYSHQIKEAVEQMLETEVDPMVKVDEVIAEAEEELNEDEAPAAMAGGEQGATIEAPPAWDSRYNDMVTKFSALIDNLPEDQSGMIDLDLGDFEMDASEQDALGGDDPTEDMLDEPSMDLDSPEETLSGDEPAEDLGGLDDLLSEPLQEVVESNEIDMSNLAETIAKMLEEEMTIDQDPYLPTGNFDVGSPAAKRNQENAEVLSDQDTDEEQDSEEDSGEEQMGRNTELHETVEILTKQNQQMESVLTKLENYLEESMLSNAKLLYQNRTLGDASLNERQKSKIVDAIANAESTKEAKQLFETLKATVGSHSVKSGPKSLSESVNRRGNLSTMLNSRQNTDKSKTADPFMEKMQKLAGIKK